jgi:hypothetical protein
MDDMRNVRVNADALLLRVRPGPDLRAFGETYVLQAGRFNSARSHIELRGNIRRDQTLRFPPLSSLTLRLVRKPCTSINRMLSTAITTATSPNQTNITAMNTDEGFTLCHSKPQYSCIYVWSNPIAVLYSLQKLAADV